MNLQRPFQVVAPTLDGDVLTLLARGEHALTGRAIETATGASHGGVRRALSHLVGEGVVLRERAGRAYLYRLNRDHLAAPWIEGLASLPLQLIDRLRGTIDAWPVSPTAAVLFGSAARREATRESDIDLLVIRPRPVAAEDEAWLEQLRTLERRVAAWTGNDARVLEFAEDELQQPEPVLEAAAAEGIELHGSLRRLLAHAKRSG